MALGGRPEPASFARVATIHVTAGDTTQNGVAVVQSRRDNGACDHVHRFAVDKMSDVAQRPDMIVAGPNDTGDMVVNAQPAIHAYYPYILSMHIMHITLL